MEKYLLAGIVMHFLSGIALIVFVFILFRLRTLIKHLFIAKRITGSTKHDQNKLLMKLPFYPVDENDFNEVSLSTDAEICSRKLQRGLLTLSLIAKITPLIGVAGSVYTAIKILHTVSVTNQMFPMFAAERIAYSLIPVLYGLVISIVVLTLHSFLRVLIEEVITLWEEIFPILLKHLRIK